MALIARVQHPFIVEFKEAWVEKVWLQEVEIVVRLPCGLCVINQDIGHATALPTDFEGTGEATQNGNNVNGSQNGRPNTYDSVINQSMAFMPMSAIAGPTTNLNISVVDAGSKGNMQPQPWLQKDERVKEFSDVYTQILKICGEIAGQSDRAGTQVVVDVSDISFKKLDEFHEQLQEVQKEKSDRLHKVPELVSTTT
ncbi:Microtubule-associated protein, MAP65/Ase1/PRC1 [Artemisia annua]|uniref:Microtubule-associated protein, MAP65/Ase1/PRC1 n=1 Tax=Artemisia annua TaxID=35608 RepID=A0A2U1KBE0_ARTAN|nr:Microtubule-associated protein, MAP65/Ase1/PRC1 [Artemisia annua]